MTINLSQYESNVLNFFNTFSKSDYIKKYIINILRIIEDPDSNIELVKQIYMDHNIDVIKKNKQYHINLYIVGGYVRDKLLGLENDDIDFTCDIMKGSQVVKLLDEYIKTIKNVTFANYECCYINDNINANTNISAGSIKNLFVKDSCFDFINLRKEIYNNTRNPIIEFGSIEEDYLRRDLTINALYYNIDTGEIIDFGGLYDLKNNLINTPICAFTSFVCDPLRIIRTIRFYGKFSDMLLSENILNAILSENNDLEQALINKLPRPRFYQEFIKITNFDNKAIYKVFCIISKSKILLKYMFDLDMKDDLLEKHFLLNYAKFVKKLKLLNFEMDYRLVAFLINNLMLLTNDNNYSIIINCIINKNMSMPKYYTNFINLIFDIYYKVYKNNYKISPTKDCFAMYIYHNINKIDQIKNAIYFLDNYLENIFLSLKFNKIIANVPIFNNIMKKINYNDFVQICLSNNIKKLQINELITIYKIKCLKYGKLIDILPFVLIKNRLT